MTYTKAQLDEARQSLQTLIRESKSEACREKTGTLEADDYENVAQAYLSFRQWAETWLKETEHGVSAPTETAPPTGDSTVTYTQAQLGALRQSLQTLVQESVKESGRAHHGTLDYKDYENLAQAYFAFRQWAKTWLAETENKPSETLDDIKCDRCGKPAMFRGEGGNCPECGDDLCIGCAGCWTEMANDNDTGHAVCERCRMRLEMHLSMREYFAVEICEVTDRLPERIWYRSDLYPTKEKALEIFLNVDTYEVFAALHTMHEGTGFADKPFDFEDVYPLISDYAVAYYDKVQEVVNAVHCLLAWAKGEKWWQWAEEHVLQFGIQPQSVHIAERR